MLRWIALAALPLAPLGLISPAWASPSLEQRLKAMDTIDLSSEPELKLQEMQQLLADARAAGPRKVGADSLASVQANIGGALFYLRRYKEAVAAIDAANEILLKAGLGEGDAAAQLLSNAATILADTGDYEGALQRHRRALDIRRRVNGEESLEVGSTTFGIGYVLFRQGRIEESLDYLGRGADLQMRLGREGDPLKVMRLTSFASVLSTAGYLERAVAEARKAVDYAETHLPRNHPTTGIALNNLGKVLTDTGQLAEAEAVFRRALDVRIAAHGKEHPSTAIALKNLSAPLFMLGRSEEAEALLLEAHRIYVQSGETADPTASGMMLAGAAATALGRNEHQLAEERLRQAIAALEERVGDDHVALIDPRTELAVLLARSDRKAEALALAEKAVAAAQRELRPDHQERAGAEIVLARLLIERGDVARGQALAQAALSAIERRMLDLAASPRDAVLMAPAQSRNLGRYTLLALETGRTDEAFRALQLANLNETAATYQAVAARAATGTAASAELLRQLQDEARAGQLLRSRYDRAVADDAAAEAARLRRDMDSSDERLRDIEAKLDAIFPQYRQLSRPHPISLADYRARLPRGTGLLAPLLVDGELISIAITRDRLVWSRGGVDQKQIAGDVAAIRASLHAGETQGRFDRAAAHRLYRALFSGEVESQLRTTRVLHVYGGGILSSIPMALLVTREPRGRDDDPSTLRRTAWLIRHKAIAVQLTLAPSPPHRDAMAGSFAGFGAPALAPSANQLQLATLFRNGGVDVAALRELPSLPGAEDELRQVAEAFSGRSALFVGAAATEQAVKQAALRTASVLHFATHGLVSGEMAGLAEPALVFTPPSEVTAANDGLLTASEIALLKLDADWVILSACNTSAGRNRGGPGYSGLARAFVHAGARSLLLSHWSVRDDAAARLTVETVRRASRGQTRAQALRGAMIDLMSDRSVPGGANPAVWAPFTLIGD